MRKIDGLKFLRSFFPEVCVDCVFMAGNEPLQFCYLNDHQPQMFRVRSGRACGSELNLPQKTCYSSDEVMEFMAKEKAADPFLEFVVHRVDTSYFDAIFVGTIALLSDPEPHMSIDFQPIPEEFAVNFNADVRPRDWRVAATFTYPFLGRVPVVDLADRLFNVDSVKQPLHRLWHIGREIESLARSVSGGLGTVSRFNVYKDGSVLLDDHRCVSSFVGSRR
jgi:hypothetical protein